MKWFNRTSVLLVILLFALMVIGDTSAKRKGGNNVRKRAARREREMRIRSVGKKQYLDRASRADKVRMLITKLRKCQTFCKPKNIWKKCKRFPKNLNLYQDRQTAKRKKPMNKFITEIKEVRAENEADEIHEDSGKNRGQPDIVRENRGEWANHTEFLLSCVGYCVGLGNVWRFPYLAYSNGGGAFLIPYIIMLVVCGIPLFMLELSMGQFVGVGPITVWRASPIFKGIFIISVLLSIGYGMVLVSFFVTIYYNVIIAYAFFYLFASFTSVLPWTLCGQEWNKVNLCENTTLSNNTTPLVTTSPVTYTAEVSTSPVSSTPVMSRSEEYWRNRVLRIDQSSGIEDPGAVLWDLCLCLLLAWILVALCLIKGIKSSGKVVYFTATFPYVILFILLIRGCTLNGAIDGITFYVSPTWEQLARPQVWSAAAVQIFYSLGIAFGSLMAFSSYNKFNNNVIRDTLIVTIGNCGTSIFAGFAIFSVLGHMAKIQGVKIEDVADQGPGLAFIAYPQAVSLLPLPQLWSILFFFMLIMLGLDSQFGLVEAILTGMVDEFPKILKPMKIPFTIGFCVIEFLLGLIMVTEGGFHWFNLYNWYSAWYGLLFLALSFTLAAYYGYGFFFTYRWRFNQDIKLMTGNEPNWYFKACWIFITPVMLVFVIVMSWLSYSPIGLYGKTYPKWADDLGMCMSISVFAVVPIYACYRLVKAYFMKESIKSLFLPSRNYRPADASIPYDHIRGPLPDKRMRPYATSDQTYRQKVDDKVLDPYPNITL